MKLTSVQIDIERYLAEMRSLLSGASVFDSSCSPEAKVLFIDGDCGYFLKSAAKGSLRREVDMTRYFHQKGLSSNILDYVSSDCDWLLTEKIPGDDCVTLQYLSQPERLCDTPLLSGFIDLDNVGVGDRHVDLFWDAWTLFLISRQINIVSVFLMLTGGMRWMRTCCALLQLRRCLDEA